MNDHGHGSQLVKLLTGNDIGSTGSHQAGVHVPKPLVGYFPPLAERAFNPDAWLEVSDGERSWRWRYIHYNNEVHGLGTRDEYRLTFIRTFLRAHAATVGDSLVLTCLGTDHARGQIRRVSEPDELVLFAQGPWRVTSIHRPRM